MTENKRLYWLDSAKGFLIFLLIFGHSIQYLALHNNEIFTNPVFYTIYSFHMPTFAFISGFLFFPFLKKYTFRKQVKRKITTILIPCISWGALLYINETLTNNSFAPKSFIYNFPTFLIYHNWFLWAIFYCSIAASICHIFDKTLWKSAIIIITLNFIYPDVLNSIGFKMMYPFFILGFVVNQYNIYNKLLIKIPLLITITHGFVLCIISLIFLHSYTGFWVVYSLDNTNTLKCILLKWILNFVTTFYFCFIFFVFNNKQLKLLIPLQHIGQKSLGIYMTQQFLFTELMINITSLPFSSTINILICIPVTLIYIILCYLIIKVLEKNLTAILLLGKRG